MLGVPVMVIWALVDQEKQALESGSDLLLGCQVDYHHLGVMESLRDAKVPNHCRKKYIY